VEKQHRLGYHENAVQAGEADDCTRTVPSRSQNPFISHIEGSFNQTLLQTPSQISALSHEKGERIRPFEQHSFRLCGLSCLQQRAVAGGNV
jgi:hypothetical protein